MPNLQSFSVVPFWDKRAMNPSTKQSRVMLTINLNRTQFRMSIKLYSTKDEFEKALTVRGGSDDVKLLRQSIVQYVSKAETILQRLPNPTKDVFIKLFKSDADFTQSSKTDVFSLYQIRYDEVIAEKRFNTGLKVRSSMRSFRNYLMWKKDKLSIEQRNKLKKSTDYVEPTVELFLEDIDEKFLKAYTDWMLSRDCSDVTIGIFMYHMKEVYMKAVSDGIVVMKANPFANIKIGTGVKSTEVLYPEQIKKLWEYVPDGVREHRSKAFFFLCYLLSGMNFKDLATLKWKNIKGDILMFNRSKTKRKSKNKKLIRVHLHDEARRILNDLATPSSNPDDFIFPWFNECKDEKHLYDTIKRHARVTNKKLTLIGDKINLGVHLNLGLARHSFATKLKLDGTPVAFISEALGHSSVDVTEHYLKNLPDENLKQISSGLLKFK